MHCVGLLVRALLQLGCCVGLFNLQSLFVFHSFTLLCFSHEPRKQASTWPNNDERNANSNMDSLQRATWILCGTHANTWILCKEQCGSFVVPTPIRGSFAKSNVDPLRQACQYIVDPLRYAHQYNVDPLRYTRQYVDPLQRAMWILCGMCTNTTWILCGTHANKWILCKEQCGSFAVGMPIQCGSFVVRTPIQCGSFALHTLIQRGSFAVVQNHLSHDIIRDDTVPLYQYTGTYFTNLRRMTG